MPENSSDLTFEQIEIGLCKEFHVDITQSMVDDFAKISGDFSPIHMNDELAKSTKFGKRIVHQALQIFQRPVESSSVSIPLKPS